MKHRNIFSSQLCMLLNLALVYVAYGVCRLAFLAENWDAMAINFSWDVVSDLLCGAWMFDTSAILYTNALYILLMILPLHYKESRAWQRAAKWIFIVCNAICIAANLADTAYFRYTGRRTTASVFSEFAAEDNIGRIVGIEFLRHWYFVLLAILLIFGLWKIYFMPSHGDWKASIQQSERQHLRRYYVSHALLFLVFVPLCLVGMRGGAAFDHHPITNIEANDYVEKPQQALLVLNTPFSIIRTIGKKSYVVPSYYPPELLDALYSPIHHPADSAVFRSKNVVVLIVESMGREYIGGFNKWLENGSYRGYTPFVDSLMQHSATWQYSYCNGRGSIDGMPSILSGIPKFVESLFVSSASMNNVSGLAGELKHKGYYSAFFHGAWNDGSMGFQGFAKASGFNDYFGRTAFDKDERFSAKDEFDGTWAIWDEPFLQFYAKKMSEFKQPFVTSIFTTSSHHPFVVPDKYKDLYPEEGIEIHKAIRYVDYSLRRFFQTVCHEPWYKNTLFVITNDHTNMSDHAYYQTSLGGFCSPIILFDPSGEIKPGMREGIAQQIDIMPTVLGYLGYDREYVAFGKDLLRTKADDTWAVNYINGIYQYVKGDYLLQFNGERATGLYRFRTDSLLSHNIVGRQPDVQPQMERELKAIIQSYMTRMVENKLVVGGEE